MVTLPRKGGKTQTLTGQSCILAWGNNSMRNAIRGCHDGYAPIVVMSGVTREAEL